MAASLTLAALQTGSVAELNAFISAGLRRGDPQILDDLIENFQHRLMRYLIFLTNRRDLAEDMFQEIWIRVLERGSQYTGSARFDTWLFSIARNMVIDHSRRRQLASLDEMCEPGEDGHGFAVPATGRSPLDNAQSGQISNYMREVLTGLDAHHREVLVLRFYEDLTLEEIATLTRAPLSTVKSRLYRGMAALKPRLQASGYTGLETGE